MAKLAGVCLASLLLVSMVVMVLSQHQTINRIRNENRLLHQEVERLVSRSDQLAKENLRLSQAVAAHQTEAGTPAAQEQFLELLRLRGQVGVLRHYEQEAEQARREQMQAAQAKLPEAEAGFERITWLHSKQYVSAAEVEQARLAVELLKAEARGDTAEMVRTRLQHAEGELARAAELHRKSLISQAEFDQAGFAVELLRAEARGDTAEAARIRLQQAETELERAAELHRKSLISEMEYEKAVRKLESARAAVP